jgi:hypothetical protein
VAENRGSFGDVGKDFEERGDRIDSPPFARATPMARAAAGRTGRAIARVASPAHIARLHTNEAGSSGRYGGAIAQQAEDVANQLEALAKRLEEIREDLAAHK